MSGTGQVAAAGSGDFVQAREQKRGLKRYQMMPKPLQVIYLLGPVVALIMFVLHNEAIAIGGQVLSGPVYYYTLFAVMIFNVFMGLAATVKQRSQAPKWFDYALGASLVGCLIFFALNSEVIAMRLWEPPPNNVVLAMAIYVAVASLEGGRRIGGWSYVGLLLVAVIYPLFCGSLPGILQGYQLTLPEVMADFAFGANGMLGLPAQTLGGMLMGFYFFAGFINGMGGGEFFQNLASSIAGRFRGGPAQVSVLGSAFFGMLSGSIIANIVAQGPFTIPTMKKIGYPAEYAAAIEAVSSTGGPITPPILGGMAFVSAVIGGFDYNTIMIASIIPCILYYWGLTVQVDAYAAKIGLKGLPVKDLPNLFTTLKQGWIFIAAVVILVVGLMYFQWGYITPVYATVAMFLLSYTSKKTALTWKKLVLVCADISGLINYGMAVFISMGLIMVGLLKTGVAGSLTTWVMSLGGDELYLILIFGVIFNIVMGMFGLYHTAHLFLAVTMAPAVAQLAHVPLWSVHLFIIYYAILGGLTPPVALHAFIAASIAGANGMRTAWVACRLGIILFFVPIFFVLQPALVMEGPPLLILYHAVVAIIGVWFLTSGLEGYIVGAGKVAVWERVVFIAGGLAVCFPENISTWVGLALCGLVYALHIVRKRVLQSRLA